MKSLVVGAMLLQSINAQIGSTAGSTDTIAAAVPPPVLNPAFATPAPQPPTLGTTPAPPAVDAAPQPPPLGASQPPTLGTAPSPPAVDAAPQPPTLGTPQPPTLGAPQPATLGTAPPPPILAAPEPPTLNILPPLPVIDAAPALSTPDVISTAAIVDPAPVSVISFDGPAPGFPSVIAALPQPAALPYGSPYDPSSLYDPYAQPAGWQGDDNGIYDGEDDTYPGGKGGGKPPIKKPEYGYDDYEECPAWCSPEDDSYDPYPASTTDYDYSPYQPTPPPEYPDYEPATDPYPVYEKTSAYIPYPKVYPTPSPKYPADPYEPYPTPKPDYEADPQYYPEPEDKSYPQLKKVRSILRAVRRQFDWPQPQPIYSEDDDSGEYDGEDGSIPDWLYDISGAPKKPAYTPEPKPKCPKSCYKPKYTADGYATKPEKPTYTYTRKGGYKTTADPYKTTEDPYKTTEDPYYYPEPTTDGYYDGTTTKAWYPQGNSSGVYWPTGPTSVPDMTTSVPDMSTSVPSESTSVPEGSTSVPDMSTSVPSESTVAPYEPTTFATYYQPQGYPAQTGGGYSDPGSPAGDYTGDTLDTVCPKTCNPFNPAENFCDLTTGCATTGGSKYYCACRAGFRADNYNAKDFSKQFKVAGQPYVYLAVSTSCNTPCSDSTCSEVLERSQCK